MSSNPPTPKQVPVPRQRIGVGAATTPKAVPGNTNSIAAQYARAKAAEDERLRRKSGGGRNGGGELNREGNVKSPLVRLNEWKAGRFGTEWVWVWGFFGWLL